MTPITEDPNDPRLKRGADDAPVEQQEAYLVLTAEERARGFVRPVRHDYKHVGPPGPRGPLADLTDEQRARYSACNYVKWEAYPESELPVTGRFWTQAQLDARGCGAVTTMAREIAETYARNPSFYGATYCIGCRKHRPVGAGGEFVWLDGSRVGT